MRRSEAMKQYLMENGEQIIADTIFLAQHQSPTIRKEYVEKHADAMEEDDDVQNVWHNWEE